MLPFLQPKKLASIIIAKHTEKGAEPMHEEGEPAPHLMSAAEELIRAVHDKDAAAVAKALSTAMGGGEGEG